MLQKLPVQNLDDINHRRRARETLNKVLDHSFDDSKVQTSAEKLAGITPVNSAYPPGNVLRYGAESGGDSATNRAAFQSALDTNSGIWIPDGSYTVNASLFLRTYNSLHFQSRNAVIKANMTSALLAGENPASNRPLHINIFSGTLDGTAKTNAGSIGVDCTSITMLKMYGTYITNVEKGWVNGGSGSLGAYYNEGHGVDISTVDIGIDNGTLGNDNKMLGGRVNDCRIGTRDNNNSGNCYVGMECAAFTQAGHLNSDVGSASNTKYICSRLENPPTAGIGIDIRAAAQICNYIFPQFFGLTTNVSDAVTTKDTNGWSDLGFVVKSSPPVKGLFSVSVNYNMASLAAGAFRQEGPVTVTGVRVGDFVGVTAPASFPNNISLGGCIVTANDTAYFTAHNPSGGAVDPPAGNFIFGVIRP